MGADAGDRRGQSTRAEPPLLERMLAGISDAFVTLDRDFRYTYANPRAAEFSGRAVQEMLGRTLWELFPAVLGTEMEAACRRAVAGGRPERFEYYYPPFDRWFEQRLYPTREGLTILSTDITDRRRAEEALSESNRRLAAVLESITDAFYALDREGRFTYVNRHCQELMGRPAAELLGRRLLDVFPQVVGTEFDRQFARALREQTAVHFEAQGPQDERWFSVHAYPSADGLSIYFRDVTDRKRAAEELARSRRLFERIAEVTPDILYLYDLSAGRTLYCNPQLERLLGHPTARYAEPGFAGTLVHPNDRPAVGRQGEHFARLADGEVLQLEYRMRHADGSYRRLRTRNVVFSRTPEGRTRQVLGVAEDVTAERQAEQTLDRYRLLSQHAQDIVLFVRTDGRIVEANDAAVAAYGHDREALLGLNVLDLRAAPTADAVAGQMLQADSKGVTFETLHRRRDGSVFPVEVSSRGADVAGERLLLSIVRDITERKRAEEALREADRRKDEFLAMLAHELRNPLAPILTAVQVQRLAAGDEEILRQQRDLIERQVRLMKRLLDDLLDVSRITRGTVELRKEVTDLAAVLAQAVETSRPLLAAKRHELTVALPAAPVRLEADPTRLAQVFTNLLNNAAKYTDPGGHVRLTLERHGGEAVVRVRDNGVGMSAAMLEQAFELFAQADRSLDRSQGGLGIGLTLARSLAELHGGTLTGHSEGPGRGSEFVVRLPVLPGEPGADGAAEAPALAAGPPRRVLVVDDNDDAAHSLALLLRLQGHEVRTAHDGPEGLRAADAFRPEVVLLDLGLPGMDGYEVARRLRRQPGQGGVLLIAMTGYGQAEDQRRSREAGFDHHLVKPAEPGAVAELLRWSHGVRQG